ncbi:unnamed protein product [Effrenium voratum]|uniref:PDEase domain-containing protein n=1 Tax=Effrenium voratum TaxID=2562239 RepID=A0AA36JJT0_9DINO|nr:unnamed protein product [Effrenium voratum]
MFSVLSFSFDALSVAPEQRHPVMCSLARRMAVAEKLQVHDSSVDAYLQECLESMPLDNPYHGQSHVLDVLQFLTTLLSETGLEQAMSPLQISVLVLAAAAHDVDHTGTTNNLLAEQGHEFVEESEEGVGAMESHSARRAEVLIEELLLQNATLQRLVRRTIHGTDLAQHGRILENFHAAIQEREPQEFFQDTEHGVLLMQLLLKAADVSNPARPLQTAKAWNSQIYEEFYAEGDQVLSAGGEPNPLHDRRTNNIPKSSAGFINFHVKGIFVALRDFVSLCKEQGIPGIRPEGVEQVLANLDRNAACFAEEAASQKADGVSVRA